MTTNPDTASDKKPLRRNNTAETMLAVVLVVAVLLFIGADIFFHPLRSYEATLYLIIVTSPCWIILAEVADKKIKPLMPDVGLTKPRSLPIKPVFYLICILFTLSATLTLNAILDESPEQICAGPVNAKYISHHKNSTSYYVEIPTCTANKFPAITLDTHENISVSRDKYNQVIVNQSKGVINYKSGRYNIPWKVSSYVETQRQTSVLAPYMQRFIDASRDPDYVQGLSYFTGKGQAKNDALAVEAFKMAASRGNALAEHDLAYMLMNGQGIPKDTHAAAQLVWQSAQQGYALAQDYLGVMYGDGINGIPQDWVQSYIWINRAAKQGYAQAIKDLDYAKSHMTHEQIEQAEQQTNQPASSSTIR